MDLSETPTKVETLRLKKERKLLENRLQGEEVIEIYEIPRYELWPYLVAAVITITVFLLAIPAGIRYYDVFGKRLRPEVYQIMLFILFVFVFAIWLLAFFVAYKVEQVLILTNKRLVLVIEAFLLSGIVKRTLRKEARSREVTHVSSKKFSFPHPVLLMLGFLAFFISVMLEIYRKLGLLESDLTFYVVTGLMIIAGFVLIILSITGYRVVSFVFELRFGKSHGPDTLLGLSLNSVPIIWTVKGNNRDAERLFEKGSVLIWRLSRQDT